MPWYVWVAIIYLAIDRIATIMSINRKTIQITRGFAVVSLITGGLFVWVLVAAASH